jgi:hypothetical protein
MNFFLPCLSILLPQPGHQAKVRLAGAKNAKATGKIEY